MLRHMATVSGKVEHSLEDAVVATRRVAGEQGWALREGESSDRLLIFKKGVKAFSWGSRLRVELTSSTPSETRVSVSTAETFALTDWGRGRRAANRLLDRLGARKD